MLGYKDGELKGKQIDLFLIEANTKRILLDFITHGRVLKNIELNFRAKNERKIPVIFSSSMLRDSEENISGTFCIVKDITKIRQAQDELKKAYVVLKQTQEQLIQAEKMQAVGILASGVAHEVKNPLGIIILGVDYLEKKLPPQQKHLFKILNSIKVSVNKADGIIRALLEFSRVTKINLLPEDINDILGDSLDLVKQKLKFEQLIQIIKEIKRDIPRVLVDKNKIEQVFINIILNAIQAITDKGKIFIRCYDTRLKETKFGIGKRSKDYFRRNEQAIIVEIEDTGIGISEVSLKKIFDPFFTTKAPAGGSGLGLSVCLNIIDIHKGLIEVKSQVGEGTKVIITLKIARR